MDKLLDNSLTIQKYKSTMRRCIKLYYPEMDNIELDRIIDYSIEKRYKKADASVVNSYKNIQYPDGSKKPMEVNMTLLEIADYIASKEPIVTSFGTMFKKHADVPNPLAKVVQSFLDARKTHKNMMFKYPRGSEEFEKYNLLQSLDKIDCNGLEMKPNIE